MNIEAILQEIEYAVHHGWPHESLKRLENMAAMARKRAALAAPSAEPVAPAAYANIDALTMRALESPHLNKLREWAFIGPVQRADVQALVMEALRLAAPAQPPAAQAVATALKTLLDIWHGGHLTVRREAAGYWDAAVETCEALLVVEPTERQPLTLERIHTGAMENKCTMPSGEFADVAFRKGVRFAEREHNIQATEPRSPA